MLFLNNSYLKELECKIVNINNNQIILNQTIFYAKSGGQPGDTGTLSNYENNINIIDTTYDVEKNIIHIAKENINFDILNILGETVLTLDDQTPQTIGQHNNTFDISKLTNGTYFLKFSTLSYTET